MKRKKKNFKKVMLFIIAVIILSMTSRIIYAENTPKTIITCTDEGMFIALKNELSQYILLPSDVNSDNYTIKIPTADIPNITEINLEDMEINNLTGIEKLTSLSVINVSKNNITSLAPLTDLTNITELKANDNRNLGNSDIASVLANKTTIQVLNLSNTGLRNISFVSSLTGLRELEIASGSFSDLSPLNNTLRKLDVSKNGSVARIEKILTLTLLQDLNISNTGIDTIDGIYNLTNLKKLYIGGLNVPSVCPVTETYYVENDHQDEYGNWYGEEYVYLTNLELLDISYNNRGSNSYVAIPTFNELKKLPKLNTLYMQGNRINDLTGIEQLEKLTTINLENNEISDLTGLVNIEYTYDDLGEHAILKGIKATSIDLSGNDIEDLSVFSILPNISNITVLDLSENHIYETSPIEILNSGNTQRSINLRNQDITIQIYKKVAKLDQYILLLPIMQNAKNSNKLSYYPDANFVTTGCTLNSGEAYSAPGLYNIIISKNKEIGDNIKVVLSGGIADGTTVHYELTDSASGIDSLMFNDPNLNDAISEEINNVLLPGDFLQNGGKILNLNHEIISRIYEFDLSNSGITDLSGIENFDNLMKLDISKNEGITDISSIQYCTTIQKLNASQTSIGDNNAVIADLEYLLELSLNNTGMTNIDTINALTNKKIEAYGETILRQLDISANQIESIDGVQNITSLIGLIATGNNIAVIPDLSNLENLERLSVYANKITAMPKVATSGALKYIYLSENKITDISELSVLTNLIELDLSNNLLDDEDLSNISNLRITSSFKIAGNKISSISNLGRIISNAQELDISKNKIENVSIIDNQFQQNGTLKANNQKMVKIIERPQTGNSVTIDLPQIFTASQTAASRFHSTSNLETSNCTISGQSIEINMDDVGDGNAYVKILNGKAKDTTLTIIPPIVAVVEFTADSWTNQDVTATISFTNRNNVTVTNNEGSKQYTFGENGEFTFEYVDEYGIEDSTLVTVDWIDKEAPTVTGVENNEVYEEAVTPVITDNEELSSIKLSVNNGEGEDFVSETEISQTGSYKITATDMAGNKTEVSFIIAEPIQKTVTYSTETITNEDVTATLTISNRNNVTYTNNNGSNTYTFTENGSFTLEYTDEYGKSGSETFTVNWIDKEGPTIVGTTANEIHEGSVTLTITDNLEIASIKISKDGGDPVDYESGTAISEYGTYALTATDTIGNQTSVTFTIVEPIQKTVTYSTETITNEDVTATLTISNRNDVTYTNNNGSNTYTFTQNGSFTLEYTDEYGKPGSETFTVNWIDKEPPVITGITDGATYDEGVNIGISDNVKIASKKISKNNGTPEDFTSGAEISGQGTYKIIVTDTAGNETTVTFTMVAPAQTVITYSTETATNQNVVATLTFTNRDNVTINNNNGKNKYTFTQNGSFTLEYTDEYGKSGTATFTVNWIDKEKPVISGITNNETYTEYAQATITDNVQISSIKLTKGNTTTDYISNTKITEPGEYVLIAKDTAGNETAVKFTVVEKVVEVTKPGDLNGDDKITVTDLLILKRIIVRLVPKTEENQLRGDMNGDKKITVTDLLILKKKIARLL